MTHESTLPKDPAMASPDLLSLLVPKFDGAALARDNGASSAYARWHRIISLACQSAENRSLQRPVLPSASVVQFHFLILEGVEMSERNPARGRKWLTDHLPPTRTFAVAVVVGGMAAAAIIATGSSAVRPR